MLSPTVVITWLEVFCSRVLTVAFRCTQPQIANEEFDETATMRQRLQRFALLLLGMLLMHQISAFTTDGSAYAAWTNVVRSCGTAANRLQTIVWGITR
jgi:hypothetical protein